MFRTCPNTRRRSRWKKRISVRGYETRRADSERITVALFHPDCKPGYGHGRVFDRNSLRNAAQNRRLSLVQERGHGSSRRRTSMQRPADGSGRNAAYGLVGFDAHASGIETDIGRNDVSLTDAGLVCVACPYSYPVRLRRVQSCRVDAERISIPLLQFADQSVYRDSRACLRPRCRRAQPPRRLRQEPPPAGATRRTARWGRRMAFFSSSGE